MNAPRFRVVELSLGRCYPYRYGFRVDQIDRTTLGNLGRRNLREYEEFLVEIKVWCAEQFGERRGLRWNCAANEFRIDDRTDATVFKLRWFNVSA